MSHCLRPSAVLLHADLTPLLREMLYSPAVGMDVHGHIVAQQVMVQTHMPCIACQTVVHRTQSIVRAWWVLGGGCEGFKTGRGLSLAAVSAPHT